MYVKKFTTLHRIYTKLINLNISWIILWQESERERDHEVQNGKLCWLNVHTFGASHMIISENYSSLFSHTWWTSQFGLKIEMFLPKIGMVDSRSNYIFLFLHFNRRETCNNGLASLNTRCYRVYILSINQIYMWTYKCFALAFGLCISRFPKEIWWRFQGGIFNNSNF